MSSTNASNRFAAGQPGASAAAAPVLFFWPERKRDGGQNAHERREMVPPDFFVEIKKRKHAKDRERDDFLDDFKLQRRIDRVAPAIRRHLKTIFKQCDAPAHEDDEQQRLVLEFQMAIPRERHENVRESQQYDGQPAGLGQVIHNFGNKIFVIGYEFISRPNAFLTIEAEAPKNS